MTHKPGAPPPVPKGKRPEPPPPLPPQRDFEGEERRAHPRFEVLAQVQVNREADVHILSAENISRGGFLLRADKGTELRLAIGDEVDVVLFFAEELDGDISARAQVVRVISGADWEAFGMRFGILSADHLGRLDALLGRLRA